MAFVALADHLGARQVTVATRDRWLTRAVTDWAEAHRPHSDLRPRLWLRPRLS